jgi:biopolymer transport protein ExbB
MINTQLFHEAIFYILYAALALAAFVVVERGIFFIYNQRAAGRLAEPATAGAALGEKSPGVAAQALTEAREAGLARLSPHQADCVLEAVFIDAQKRLKRHLWLLDTIVTAAPLLGLLGTILGIIDTFVALAHAGVSDPAGVSSGIGTALYATALGIGVALFGLLFFNLFQERVEHMGESIKALLLREACQPQTGAAVRAGVRPMAAPAMAAA